MNKDNKPSIIAAITAILFGLALFIFLYWGSIDFGAGYFARASIPEPEEEEELFLDPELIDPGEDESSVQSAPQPEAQGSPEVVEKPEPQTPVVKGEAETPAPQKPKQVTAKEKSEVKAAEPRKTEKAERQAQGKVANAFQNSGTDKGRNNSAGAGGASFGVSGHTNGWKFLGCPNPQVRLRNKVTVTVSITVDANGVVTSARARGANADIRRACEAAARQARWEPLANRKGRTADGTITFTITPR